MVRVDDATGGVGERYTWLFGGGSSGARGVLEAIASSMITVAGTIFSITIVALQLASSQFTPRVLRTFTRDRGVQFVLGMFIATFTYSLLVLRSVRDVSQNGQQAAFVPAVSVTLAVIFALACLGLLIYFIHHMARAMQAAVVVDRVVADSLPLIAKRFPAGIGIPTNSVLSAGPLGGAGTTVRSSASGYVQSIDVDALFGLPAQAPVSVELSVMIGDFVLQGVPLADVWPALENDDSSSRRICGAFRLGAERTLEADAELGIRQLADIAVKALSPGINDPTTATICIDRLAQLLAAAARAGSPPSVFARRDSHVTLIVPAPSFARLVETAFAQIRHYGMADASVMTHLLRTLGVLAALVPVDDRQALVEQARLTLAGAREMVAMTGDQAIFEAAAHWLGPPP